MAEQWLKAKLENGLSTSFSRTHNLPTYQISYFQIRSFIYSFTQHGNRVTAKMYILACYATTNITHVAIFRNYNKVSRDAYKIL